MSTPLKRPIESVDSPQSQEDRDGRHLVAMEPKTSIDARSYLSDTFRLWQLDILHGTGKSDNHLDLKDSSPPDGLDANKLPSFASSLTPAAVTFLEGVTALEGIKLVEGASLDDQGVVRKVAGEILCYGMIHKARLKVADVTSLLDKTPGYPIPSTDLYSVELEYRDRSFFLTSDSTNSLAVLNDETTVALRNMFKFSKCYFKTYLSQYEWKELVQSVTKNDKILYILVSIVLYGSHEDRNAIGEELSSNRIYLQHPFYQEADTLYDNPHVLKLDDLMPTSNLSNTRNPITAPEGLSVSQGFSDLEREDDSPNAQVRRKIAAVFNSLTRSKHLKRIKADIRIRTLLKPHQEEALDFIAQRECGPIPSEYSLWSSESHELGDFYKHKVTGAKTSQRPSENGGGILADEMGLGKTLTMISTIIHRADDAKAFAESEENLSSTPPENLDTAQHLASRSTLVVCPSPLLLEGWIDEIQMHCDGSLNMHVYHGRGRETDRSKLADSDIVLSTYHTIAAEALDASSPLYQINWFRIILDEAHIIRHMSTKLFRSVAKLRAKFRWCLTGTPVQNSLDDLAALVAFIRASPLDDPHEFRKHVIIPLIRNTGIGLGGLRGLLDSVCLRRTKKLLHLSKETYEFREVEFSASERAHYDAVESEMARAVRHYCGHARNSKGYFGVFQLQLQLRRLCNHGTFQKPFSGAAAEDIPFDPDEALAHLQQSGEDRCGYCNARVTGLDGIEDIRSGHFTLCGHLLCSDCVPRYKQALRRGPKAGDRQCSLCPKKFTADCLLTKKMVDKISSTYHITHKDYFESVGTSAKVSALIRDIQQNDHRRKSIVFSCWTRSLDLVGRYLDDRGIPFLRMDGSCSLRQRREVLSRFNIDSSIHILMMTTGTGGTGLNITIANIVYILEPQWNPKVEDQAIARVLRLGQTREVNVIRYIIKGTVEELMRSQQIRKLEFAKAGWRED